MTDEIEKGLQALRDMTKAIDQLSENMKKSGDLFLQIADTQIKMLEAEMEAYIKVGKPEAFFLDKDLQEKLI